MDAIDVVATHRVGFEIAAAEDPATTRFPLGHLSPLHTYSASIAHPVSFATSAESSFAEQSRESTLSQRYSAASRGYFSRLKQNPLISENAHTVGNAEVWGNIPSFLQYDGPCVNVVAVVVETVVEVPVVVLVRVDEDVLDRVSPGGRTLEVSSTSAQQRTEAIFASLLAHISVFFDLTADEPPETYIPD